ncbi:MAG: glycine zipper 2TM domain-containing protein [Gammaproteobacteria bacterium]|nr:glycine zipper 2TM domain-containing protein [Gammaproteobacteria bacterium]
MLYSTRRKLTATLAALALTAATGPVVAHDDGHGRRFGDMRHHQRHHYDRHDRGPRTSFSVHLGAGFGPAWAPRPAYVTPPPVYVAPAPVYVQPAPVYVQPAPVYAAPAPVYSAPVEPVYGAPSYYRGSGYGSAAPGFGNAVGAAIGGLAGSQIGKGSGKLAATAAGAVMGYVIGGNLGQPYR